MRRLTMIAALLAAPLAAGAQVIDPGMTREQVVERLGRPNGERETGAFTYLFFRNGCERTCGMSDLVILENGGVVDAIFRRAGRSFSGASSSPAGTQPEPTNVTARPRPAPAATQDAGAGLQPSDPAAPPAQGGRQGGLIFSRPATAAQRVTPGSAIQGTAGAAPAATGTPAPAAAPPRPDAAVNAVPLATPPTVVPPTVTPPTGSVPAQGAAPASTNAPASSAGPAAPNPRAPATAPPGAPSPTRPDSGSNPTPRTP